MFEKEAEEIVPKGVNWRSYSNKEIEEAMLSFCSKAIEHGFNKCLKAKLNTTTISDCPVKDEWHEIESKISSKREISKQYMPKNKEKVLLKYHFSGDDEVHISDGYYDAYDFEFHIANNPKHRIVCVIAWKESE